MAKEEKAADLVEEILSYDGDFNRLPRSVRVEP